MTHIDVRRAGPADLDLLVPLFDAYRQFYQQPSDLTLARRFLSERLGRNESVIFLALAGAGAGQTAAPAGFTQLYPIFSSTRCRRSWLLNDLFVAPAWRKAGIARCLMEAARQHGVETGAWEIELMTAHTNAPAQALYESLGYELDREFRHYVLGLER
jgi:ribosomal protein S18 acetylase RimI-like enzyme